MRVFIGPGPVSGTTPVAGDKSIAHRWLILAATASGRSVLSDLPPSLDVLSTATCLSAIAPSARGALEAWVRAAAAQAEGHGSTWNTDRAGPSASSLEVEGEGRSVLVEPSGALDCGNSGTTMRLLTGLLAASAFPAVLTGDHSLRSRPMERVAEPLRLMGADVRTTDGRAPIYIEGSAAVQGVRFTTPVPSAQVKSAVLLAGVAADGQTTVREPVATRDHTERALAALGAPIRRREGLVEVSRYQHRGFRASVPGDPSAAAFLVAGAAITGRPLTIVDVGLNPTRRRFLTVMERMGVPVRFRIDKEELGEPVGEIEVGTTTSLVPATVSDGELPLLHDEVPILAVLAAAAEGESFFRGAAELRLKESDRLSGIRDGIRALGGRAEVDGDDLVIGGGGLSGGIAESRGDHRLAMAFAIAGLGSREGAEVDGIEHADVSFPGFLYTLRRLGAPVRELG